MDNWGGFGINSIVWEERTFTDGGKYYYSPATGQARLDLGTKTVMKGGILADEMGLEVRYLRPFNVIEYDKKKFSEEMLSKIESTGIVALGLGMRALK